MNKPHSLASPTVWLASGMGLVVGLVCLVMGAGDGFAAWLKAGYEAQGFPAMSEVGSSSPVSLIVMVILTFGAVFSIEGTPGVGRRLMLMLSALVLIAMASPILALWGLFWSPLVLILTVLWAGMAAMVHAHGRDKAEVVRSSEERSVMRMNPPVSPNKRRSRL
ncbi:hypothetical protein AAFN60_13425 [Roseibacillus persicicus]|uniref:hypothetical protein n=1 Tax=Roseibacillus persicicus TaxID=454148 RepID=UPI00398A8E6A